MGEYGRGDKDYSLRYIVYTGDSEVVPGGFIADVIAVGHAYSPATFIVLPDGMLFTRVDDHIPDEAIPAFLQAQAKAEAESKKRKDKIK